jgi:SAM-dependent methyltransferase
MIFKKKTLPKWKTDLIIKGKFLDVGCQHGKLKDYITKEDYYGLDYDVDFESQWEKEKLIIADIRKVLPIKDEDFEVIWASHVIEHINTQEQYDFVKECYRILKPGGNLILFAPTPYHWFFWDHPLHQRPCTHGSLSGLCTKNKFKVVEAKYSKLRWFPTSWQRFLRFPPMRWFLWDTYIIAQKPE